MAVFSILRSRFRICGVKRVRRGVFCSSLKMGKSSAKICGKGVRVALGFALLASSRVSAPIFRENVLSRDRRMKLTG